MCGLSKLQASSHFPKRQPGPGFFLPPGRKPPRFLVTCPPNIPDALPSLSSRANAALVWLSVPFPQVTASPKLSLLFNHSRKLTDQRTLIFPISKKKNHSLEGQISQFKKVCLCLPEIASSQIFSDCATFPRSNCPFDAQDSSLKQCSWLNTNFNLV